MNKISFFIDAEYVLQGLRALKNKPHDIKITKFDFNWKQFVNTISQGQKLESVFYYTARLDEAENPKTYNQQKEYLSYIQSFGFVLRLGKMIKIKNKSKRTWNENRNSNIKNNSASSWVQKGIDTKIVLDLVAKSYENNYDTAVLVTGDEDFAETIEYLRLQGKIVKLIAINRIDSKLSENLINAANNYIILDYTDLCKRNIIIK